MRHQVGRFAEKAEAMTYDRAAIMRDAHKRFRDGKRLGLDWSFSQCLVTARAAAARRAMTTMTHEGYLATLEVDEAAGVIHGRAINARAVLTFEGETLADLQQAFADTIADYRDWCKERGGNA
jgi:hypothetical protein